MIGAYLIDTVTLRMNKGMDTWQEPNTPTDVTVAAFVDYKERRIQNEAGEVVVSLAKVYMRPRTIITSGYATRATNTISSKDRVIVDGIEHAIVRIGKARDFTVRALEAYIA